MNAATRSVGWLAHTAPAPGVERIPQAIAKELSPITTVRMAMPGKDGYHQLLQADLGALIHHRAPFRVGGTAPRPMNLKPAVSTMAAPTSSVLLTTSGACVPGRIWRVRMRKPLHADRLGAR